MDSSLRLYEGYAQAKHWQEENFGQISEGERHYLRSELTRHGVSLRGRHMLEIGFGSGNFLRFARDEGADVVGIEIQDDLLTRAAANGFEAYPSLEALHMANGKRSFTLVVAFDVLEHLTADEAIDMLKKLRDLVDPSEGMLLARFPNGDSPFSLPIQNGDFTHRSTLGAGVVGQLLRHSGWKLAYLGEPTWAFNSMRDVMVGGTRNLLRRGFEKIILQVYYGRSGPQTFYPNYILTAKPLPRP
jgi:2-polyprenyl-3-methyl-5-hydroxy-6-metoxy-1,4-benzoquinol methylase